MKDKINKLHKQGLNYSQIARIVGCDPKTVKYNLLSDQERIDYNTNRRHYYKENKDSILTRLRISGSKVNRIISRKISRFVERTHIFKNIPDSYSLKNIQTRVYRFKNQGDIKVARDFTTEEVMQKIGEDPVCYLTGLPIDLSKPRSYHFDHIIPTSRGGSNDIDNLGICTKEANLSKRDLTPDEFINLCKLVLENNGYTVKLANS
jgi:5-methylcytosine-specific restriction endonuclease McrA